MSGVTDLAFRLAVRAVSGEALGLVFTEFVSVEALTRRVQRSMEMMELHPDEHPIAVQLYGHREEALVDAALMAQDAGADVIDLNAGCPVKKVVRRGDGAALMKTPRLLGELLRALRKVVRVPLTLKIRAGWDPTSVNAVEVARIAEAEGVDCVTVHGRTRSQGYSGRADWRVIQEVADALRIPVVGNGDVDSPEAALERLGQVDGVMIGRAALGNPWIFRQTADLATNRAYYRPTFRDRITWWLGYGRALEERLPPKALPGRMKQLAGPLTRGLVGGADLRRRVHMAKEYHEIVATLEAWLARG